MDDTPSLSHLVCVPEEPPTSGTKVTNHALVWNLPFDGLTLYIL